MQKIARIYVGNYGVNAAWYDGVIFDLTDPNTALPADTIINLENGGGKTTLLSFVFSCFEPAQEKFLKHLQDRNHRFTEYFSKDGRPGVILIEWELPSREPGGKPYRIVVGQAVSLKPNSEKNEVDRVFFSFEVSSAIQLESVPCLKWQEPPLATMPELMKWMHDRQKENTDFFWTRVQQDWQKHLRDGRLIDVEMLQLQVQFSAQEGGIDTSFLTFTSEPEFVRKFFDLTLDPTRADAVRQAVMNTCDKLARKPEIQTRLKELLALRSSLAQFGAIAIQYSEAKQSQSSTITQGQGLVLSLESRHRAALERGKADAEMARLQTSIVATKLQGQKDAADKEVVLTFVQHFRKVDAARTLKSKSEAELASARQKLRYIRAAEAHSEIRVAQAQKSELEAKADLQAAELRPWRDAVTKHGTALYDALTAEMLSISRLREQAESAQKAAVGHLGSLSKERDALALQDNKFVSEESTLRAQEDAFSRAAKELVDDGVIEADEPSSVAVSRWTEMAAHQRIAETRLKAQAAEQAQIAQTLQGQAKTKSENAVRLESLIPQHQKFIAEGQHERESLSQLPITRLAAEADIANPDSPALLAALDQVEHSSAKEVGLSEIHLAQLRASNASIEETGVAGNSRDVNAVIAKLKEMGVKSARPFNSYIAEAIPDPDRARLLIASDPSRFLGVCVASGEFAKATGIRGAELNLSAPVVVSRTTLEPDDANAECIVMSAEDDSAFNLDAAQSLLFRLRERLVEEESRRKIFLDRQRDATAVKERLSRYQQRFGNGAVQQRIDEVANIQLEIAASIERAELLSAQVLEAKELGEAYREEAVHCATLYAEYDRNIRAIERFITNHESDRAARFERMEAVAEERQLIRERQQDILLAQAEFEDTKTRSGNDIHEYQQTQRQLFDRRNGLKYRETSSDGQIPLAHESTDLATLSALYEDAAQLFEAEETNRLGLLKMQLDAAHQDLTAKSKLFESRYTDVTPTLMAPYVGENFELLARATEQEIESHDKASRTSAETFAVVDSDFKTFNRTNKLAYQPTEQMLAASDGSVEADKALAASHKVAFEEGARVAEQEAKRAQTQARDAEVDAKNSLTSANFLRSGLALPDLLIADPVPLEVDYAEQIRVVLQQYQSRMKLVETARRKASNEFEALKALARGEALIRVEPDIATQLQRNDFEAACADIDRLLNGIGDRIGTTQVMLDGMQSDFNACVGELLNLANSAITLLNSATSKKVPSGAPWVGGKSMLKMTAKFNDINQDARKQALQIYLDSLIDTNVVPDRGAKLVSESVIRMYGRPLGIRLLKMTPDESLQYVAVDKIQNSGGEAVVMAMFLYLLINQIRSETQAKVKRTGGGPLILDNPFAKATNPAMWRAQRLLAEAMDVQLIFATALPDYNAVAEFPRFIHLRKVGRNNKSGRWHLEVVDFMLNEEAAEPV